MCYTTAMLSSVALVPWLWVFITVVCIIIETFSLSLTTIWFACGALVTALLSLTGLSFRFQLIIFVGVSLVLLLSTRPIALKKLRTKRVATNSDAIIGKEAVVTATITAQEKGAIKVNGLEWSAKSADGSEIPKGALCTVCAIEGVTAVVNAVN